MCRQMMMFGLMVGLLLSIAGCASTTISGAWKDPQYQGGTLDKVLVIGIAKQETMKRLYEDAFVAALHQQGITASPGYKILPTNGGNDKELIVKQVKELDFKYVLISRVAAKRTIGFLHPSPPTFIGDASFRSRYYRNYPYYNHYDDYYDHSFSTIINYTPAYGTTSDLVILETNIYETTNSEIIYSVQTETFVDYGKEKIIKEVVKIIMDNLKANQLL
jgi:hypothetical protein